MSSASEPLNRSASAERMRRARERRRLGTRMVVLELYSADIAALVRLGWIASADCDRPALEAGFCDFVNQSLALRVTLPRTLE
jgi:hypothetical protein